MFHNKYRMQVSIGELYPELCDMKVVLPKFSESILEENVDQLCLFEDKKDASMVIIDAQIKKGVVCPKCDHHFLMD